MSIINKLQIAVNGYAASGKGTICKLFAKENCLYYVDVGLIFRFAAYSLNCGLFNDLCEFQNGFDQNKWIYVWDGKTAYIYHNLRKIYNELKDQQISQMTADLSLDANFHTTLERISQTVIDSHSRVIADGRNVGISIMKNPDFKFMIICNLNTRAKRRLIDYKELGVKLSLIKVKAMLKDRDALDSGRLKKALESNHTFLTIKSSGMTEDVIKKMRHIVFDRKII